MVLSPIQEPLIPKYHKDLLPKNVAEPVGTAQALTDTTSRDAGQAGAHPCPCVCVCARVRVTGSLGRAAAEKCPLCRPHQLSSSHPRERGMQSSSLQGQQH